MKKILHQYVGQDYIQRKRAVFLFYFIIAALGVSITVLITSVNLQLSNPLVGQIYIEPLIPIICAIVIFLASMFLLTKGRYNLSANLTIFTALLAIWLVIFLDPHPGLSRINTIVFIFGALSMLPLLSNSKRSILLFGFVNLAIFFVFFMMVYPDPEYYGFRKFELLDTLIDVVLALTFTIIIHYNVYSINTIALTNAKEEIRQRKKIAAELEYHKSNLENLVNAKTKDLEEINEILVGINVELSEKNDIIEKQNKEMADALQNLRDTQASLIQAEKMASLGILTAGVAHEINNPLNFIIGAYDGLIKYFNKHGSNDNNHTDILLESIKTGVDRTSAIVQGLNQFSRDSGHNDEYCDIHAIIDNCLIIIQSKIKSKVEIRKIYYSEDISCIGNSGKLHQVFVNILSNASDAVSEGGLIDINTSKDNNNLIITIKDNGHGIDELNLNKVTDPFFTTKPPGKGTGLGLSISYSIIKEHNGKLEIISNINKGTEVIVTLPAKTH